jgi:integrase
MRRNDDTEIPSALATSKARNHSPANPRTTRHDACSRISRDAPTRLRICPVECRARRNAQGVQERGGRYPELPTESQNRNGKLAAGQVSKRFHDLAAAAGLRQTRLHDLRHGWASLLLASGTDIALVSKLLGHSSIGITSDTYSHLLEGVGRDAAQRASALVPRTRSTVCDQSVTNQPAGDADAAGLVRSYVR